MIRFIKELLAGNVIEGGAGGAYPGADGQPGKAYFRGADGEWQEMNGGKETTVTWRPA